MKQQLTIRRWDLSRPIGMMPAYVLREVAEQLRSKIIEAGEVEDLGDKLEGRGAIYVKTQRGEHTSESVWIDDGNETYCYGFNLGGGWQRTDVSKRMHGGE